MCGHLCSKFCIDSLVQTAATYLTVFDAETSTNNMASDRFTLDITEVILYLCLQIDISNT